MDRAKPSNDYRYGFDHNHFLLAPAIFLFLLQFMDFEVKTELANEPKKTRETERVAIRFL